MKNLIASVLFLVSVSTGLGQGFDELIDRLEEYAYIDRDKMMEVGQQAMKLADGDPSKEARVLVEYANHFYYEGKLSQADSVFAIAQQRARLGRDSHLVNKIAHRRTVILSETGSHREAERSFRKQLRKLERENDKLNLIYVYNALAQIKIDHDVKRDSGIYYYNKALSIARDEGMDYQVAFLLNNIGLLKIDMGDQKAALADFETALEVAQNTNRERLKAHIVNNIGLIHLRDGNDDEAEKYFLQIMDYSRKYGALRELGIAFLNLGSIHFNREDYTKSREFYDSSLYYLNLTNSVVHIPRALNTIARNELYEGDFLEVLRIADSSAHLAEEVEILSDLIMSHSMMARAYDSLGELRLAIEEQKIVKELSDSSHQLEYDKAVAEMATRYEVQEKESALISERAKNEVLQKKQEIDRIERNAILTIGGALAGLIVVLIYLRHLSLTRKRQREYSQELLAQVENERNRIAKELHDDIGQQLSMAMNKVNTNTNTNRSTNTNKSTNTNRNRNRSTSTSGEVSEVLENAIESTRRIARDLYPSYLRKVDLSDALEKLLDRTEESTGLTCSYEIQVDGAHFTDSQKLHVYRIVQECINNTIKHANASAIKVEVVARDSRVELTYRDNGRGLSKKVDMSGIGMMSIMERSRILGGDIDISRGRGFHLNLSFDTHAHSNRR